MLFEMQGRDANRKLQRSIKAGKQRERMPSLVEQLRQVLTHWQMEHRQPFSYDGWDYKVRSTSMMHDCLSCDCICVSCSSTQSVQTLCQVRCQPSKTDLHCILGSQASLSALKFCGDNA